MKRVLLATLVSTAGCGSDIDGELFIATERVGEEVFEPTDCTSGEPLFFFGVDLWDDDRRRVRFRAAPT